ncbi:pentatricopeptide repeat-containing protein At2g21090 [Mangifera indica]|uniref:pentatricopeptide repeat-containing protein At2g21090 n=1 Tax=Mangifera indica TaxID=29780 RepID=UPI001CFBC073|nr:pentatricopeptide repeat-containing protein At2g21090 [Mangifera indica]
MCLNCRSDVGAFKVFCKMSSRNLYSYNGMLSGYAKLGQMKAAKKLFDKMVERDVISWNTMIIGYARSENVGESVRLFKELRRLCIGYNEFSFAGVLTVCVKMEELKLTKQVHGQVLVAGFLSNLVISSSVLDSYAKCGEMNSARRLFEEMQVRDVLAWTALVSGYAKWGDMESARELFNEMPEKNPVSWTALIAGYARNGFGRDALELFSKMIVLHVRPDQFTYSSCLCACSSIASLRQGKQIHGFLIRTKFKPNTIVVSSLIDMYSKCGCLEVGRQVFKFMDDKKDPVLWNTMISALAQHGHGEEAIQMFDDMFRSGSKPNKTTLVVILHACSHSGLVHEGLNYFESMTRDHGIVPNQEHYACLIDLLGRAGCFDLLMNQLERMPCKPDGRVWNAIIGVCRIHGNIEWGRKAAEQLIELEPQSSAAYVLLSNIYAALGRWDLVEKVRHLMDERRVKKEQASSWIEIHNKVHAFTASDRLHPLKDVIYSVLEQLAGHLEDVALSLDTER